jgi:hypothetical protein
MERLEHSMENQTAGKIQLNEMETRAIRRLRAKIAPYELALGALVEGMLEERGLKGEHGISPDCTALVPLPPTKPREAGE